MIGIGQMSRLNARCLPIHSPVFANCIVIKISMKNASINKT